MKLRPLEAGDDHEVIRVFVQAEEAEIGQDAEAGGAGLRTGL
ncbi:hypothetical protein [Streptomyces purpurascens]